MQPTSLNRLFGFKQHGRLAFLALTATLAAFLVVNTRVARSAMDGGWLSLLREKYGGRLAHSALADTPLDELGKEWGFGLYVVREALDSKLKARNPALLLHRIKDTMDRYTDTLGIRSFQVRGTAKLHYRTLQMTDDLCTCKYVYEGNVKNPLIKTYACPAVSDFTQSFYMMADASPGHHFHQIVGFCYAKDLNQKNPWHSDQSDLLSHNADIVSVSLGCGGVFCYMPNERQVKSGFQTSPSLSERHGVQGDRQLLSVDYEVACRSSLVMFC